MNRESRHSDSELLGQILIRKIPIDEMVEKRGDVVEAPMLIVQIVRVLPHIDRQQRCYLWHGERCLRIGLRDDAQSAVLEHEPSPAAPELIAGDRDELWLRLCDYRTIFRFVLRSAPRASPPPPGRMLRQ